MHIPFLSTLTLALIPAALSSPHLQSPMSASPSPTIYFGYGSNLWLSQMRLRCPSSQYIGLARLPGYTWIISTRGYANIVERTTTTTTNTTNQNDAEVWGMVYTLEKEDEERLDKNEGVPVAYTKEYLACEFWSAGAGRGKIDTSLPYTSTRDMLVYIDRMRTAAGEPHAEYVYRMNRGIEDALGCGVPEEYVEGVVRGYIPEDEVEGVEEFARGQARGFRDESGVIE